MAWLGLVWLIRAGFGLTGLGWVCRSWLCWGEMNWFVFEPVGCGWNEFCLVVYLAHLVVVGGGGGGAIVEN